MKTRLLSTAAAFLIAASAFAQTTPKAAAFKPLCDTLRNRLQERTTVYQDIKLTKVMKRGKVLDLYFNAELSYYPWHKGDDRWFIAQVKEGWDDVAKGFELGKIYTNRYELEELSTPLIGNSGKPSGYSDRIDDPRTSSPRFISRVGAQNFDKGLSDRYIALWQSHGRYYDENEGVWMWQRARLHRTVEDMYTQSYVLPFLIPMLENAGAYVLTPRERDTAWREFICDNDRSFSTTRSGTLRRLGSYSETGSWSDAGEGFADFKEVYTFEDNPFKAGSARKADCSGTKPTAAATWTPDIDKRGSYAVYISYRTLDNSSTAAYYTVHHMGGETSFKVNQKRGGGTWIYLGTFEFDEGREGYVTLDNRGDRGSAVSADAVKIGGGMGKLERGGTTSGMASSAEGAHYWMQWAGVGTEITRNWDTDYVNDYATRGAWTVMMKDEKNIPFDMSLAFHTDAGLTQNDSIVGTLAIYTLRCDGNRKFENSTRDRFASRVLCDYVQSQVVSDLRQDFVPDWTRRGLWDKSYSETRTTDVPAMILELLSHQNFADMKCGLDPSFRFTVCRAVYKGILKTMSEYYGCDYVVQPLPVSGFAVRYRDGNAVLSWKEVLDEKEPTAAPDGYIVYTRVDGGAFDEGRKVSGTDVELPIENGHVYSYRVEAFNAGGRSFPSETLSIGRPVTASGPEVLIVNNFDRISAPAWFDTPSYAGFDGHVDSGVPYINDISYIGENYEFNRSLEFVDNDSPGFGATLDNRAGEIIAGNTFDYPYEHGRILLSLGYPFHSVSKEAFVSSDEHPALADIICGKQGRTKTGTGVLADRFEVFPEDMQTAVRALTGNGCSVFISGSNVVSDPVSKEGKSFLSDVFGVKLATQFGTGSGIIAGMEFYNTLNSSMYCVERPDGMKASGKNAKVWLRYPGASFGAAVYNKSDKYRSIMMGVPLETLKSESDRIYVLGAAMSYLNSQTSAPVDRSR